jgi:excisionase family DNA binding protein
MTDDMTVAEAAEALGTSPQTVRALLRRRELEGRKLPRGRRHVWIPSRKGVDAFLSQHGRLGGRRRPRSRLAQLEHAVAQLQQEFARLNRVPTGSAIHGSDAVGVERDELRARVVALEEALAHTRHAGELQRRADEERAALVAHLLAATAAAERTDAFRREALASLEAAVAGLSRPGHPGLI